MRLETHLQIKVKVPCRNNSKVDLEGMTMLAARRKKRNGSRLGFERESLEPRRLLSTTVAVVPSISSVKGNGAVFQPITIRGHFNANIGVSGTSVRITDGRGFATTFAPSSVTATSISLLAPFYVNPQTGDLGSAAVSVQVSQQESGGPITSNTINRFKLKAPPTSKAPVGSTLLAMLRAELVAVSHAQQNLTASQQAGNLGSQIANQVSVLNEQIDSLTQLSDGQISFIDVGERNGQPLRVGLTELRQVDRLLIGTLAAQAASPSGGRSASTAGAFAKAATSNSRNLAAAANSYGTNFLNFVSNPRNVLTTVGIAVSAFTFGLEFCAGLFALPQLATGGAIIAGVYLGTTVAIGAVEFAVAYTINDPAQRSAAQDKAVSDAKGGVVSALMKVTEIEGTAARLLIDDLDASKSLGEAVISVATGKVLKLTTAVSDSAADGFGKISVSPQADQYKVNDQLELTATPDAASVFSKWVVNGVDAGTNPTLTLTLAADTTVTAYFTDVLAGASHGPYTLHQDLPLGLYTLPLQGSGTMQLQLTRSGSGQYSGTVSMPGISGNTSFATINNGTEQAAIKVPNSLQQLSVTVTGDQISGVILIQQDTFLDIAINDPGLPPFQHSEPFSTVFPFAAVVSNGALIATFNSSVGATTSGGFTVRH